MKSAAPALTVIAAAVTIVACSKNPVRATRDYIQSGDRYTSAGEHRAAMIEYRNALKITPASAEARLKLAEAAARANDVNTFTTEVLRAAEVEPDNAAAQARAAAVYLLAGRFEQAQGRAEAALAINAESGPARVVLGQALAALHKPDEGESVLRDAVRASPDDPAARVALAGTLWANGNRNEAESELRFAQALDGDDPAVNRALGLLYMATGRSPDAEPRWRKVAASPQGDPFALADYYVAVGRLSEGERELVALSGGPEIDASVTLRLASIALARGDSIRALNLVRRVRDTEPTASAARALEGRILVAEAEHEEATSALDTALKLNPEEPDAALGFAELRLAQGHAVDAIMWADRARKWRPSFTAARTVLIQALIAARQLERAVSEAREAVLQWPDQPQVYAQLGAALALDHQASAAREALARALSLDSGFVPALEVLTWLDVAEKRVAAARARLDKRLDSSPASVPILLLAARTEVTLGKSQRAEALLKRAIAAQPSSLDPYRALATLYLTQNRAEEALSEFQRLAERDPTPAAGTAAAVLLQSLGRREAAMRQYEATLHQHPAAPIAANNLAWLYQEDGRLAEALRLALVAKRQLGRTPEVNHTLGWIYYRRDEARDGIPALANAVAARPDNAMYRAHLGLAYWRTGRLSAARAELDRALATDAPFVGRDQAETVRRQIVSEGKPEGR